MSDKRRERLEDKTDTHIYNSMVDGYILPCVLLSALPYLIRSIYHHSPGDDTPHYYYLRWIIDRSKATDTTGATETNIKTSSAIVNAAPEKHQYIIFSLAFLSVAREKADTIIYFDTVINGIIKRFKAVFYWVYKTITEKKIDFRGVLAACRYPHFHPEAHMKPKNFTPKKIRRSLYD